MFASLDDVLANETARYRDEFDVIVAATKQQTTDGRAREEDTFDNDVVVAQDNFKASLRGDGARSATVHARGSSPA